METAIRACKFLFEERKALGKKDEDADMKYVERRCIIIYNTFV